MKKSLLIISIIALLVILSVNVVAQDKVVIKFYGQTGASNNSREAAHRAIFEKFEQKYPNIEVNAQFYPWEELQRKINIAAASEAGPDVVYLDCPLIPQFAYNGVIQPMDEYYTEEEIDRFLPQSVRDATYDDNFYGPPECQSSNALVYNKDMLQEAGIDVPKKLENAWDMQEFKEVLQKLTKDTDGDGRTDVYGLGRVREPNFYDDAFFILSRGEKGSPTYEAINDAGTSVDGYLNTSAAIEGFKYFQKLFTEWGVAPKEPVPDMLGTGKAAIEIGTEAAYTNVKQNYPDINVGITPLPREIAGYSNTGSLHYCLSSDTENPDAAAKLIKFMTNKENYRLMWENLGQVPADKELLAELDAYQNSERGIFKEILVEWGAARPRTEGYLVFQKEFNEALSDVMSGADVEQTVEDMVDKIDGQLQKYED